MKPRKRLQKRAFETLASAKSMHLPREAMLKLSLARMQVAQNKGFLSKFGNRTKRIVSYDCYFSNVLPL